MAKNKDSLLKLDNFENFQNEKIEEKESGEVIRENMIQYGDLVISNRAIPSILDGLKPVQRRLLYTFKDFNLINKKIKSAKVIGNTIGSFHPHGDIAVYEAMIEMTVPFKNKFPLFIKQGNFGSIDGDSAAAMRYTEINLPTDSSDLLFENINKKNVVTWDNNYDNTTLEPKVLPVKYPLHLLNGSSGIGYSNVTTQIPSYNIIELTNLMIYLIDNKFYDKEHFNVENHKEKILKIIPTVDLPTGANIYFDKEQTQEDTIFASSFGFRMRASYVIDEKNNQIVFTNIPIDTNGERIRSEIRNAGLSFKVVKKKEVAKNPLEILNISGNATVTSISSYDINNYENDAEIIVSFKKGVNLEAELSKILKYTTLDKAYSAKMMVIDENGRAKTYSLYQQICKFLEFRCHVIYQSFIDDIEDLEKNLHLLYGYSAILSNLDEYLRIITKEDENNIIPLLKTTFNIDDLQIDYLFDMRVKKLKKTSVQNLRDLITEKEGILNYKKDVISSKEKVYEVVREDYKKLLTTNRIKNKVNKRLTKIIDAKKEISQEDLLTDKEIIIMYMEDDTIAFVDKNKFKLKNRGTKTTNNKMNNTFELKLKITESCNLKDELLLISNFGKVFKLKAYEFDEQFRFIGNIINLDKDEKIVSLIKFDKNNKFYCIGTKYGKIKGLNSSMFKNTTSNRPIKAIKLEDKDLVKSFIPYNNTENEKVIILTNEGRIIKYPTSEINIIQGGNTKGTKSTILNEKNKEYVMKLFIFEETNETVLIGISHNGRAKKTYTKNITDKKRAQSPMLFFNNNEVNGKIVSGEVFKDEENEILMILTEKADVSLLKINKFNKVSRAAKGSVGLLNLGKSEKIKLTRIIELQQLSETQTQILVEAKRVGEDEINNEEFEEIIDPNEPVEEEIIEQGEPEEDEFIEENDEVEETEDDEEEK